MTKYLVKTIIVSEDIGGPFPVWKRIELFLWSDGTVTWNNETDQ